MQSVGFHAKLGYIYNTGIVYIMSELGNRHISGIAHVM